MLSPLCYPKMNYGFFLSTRFTTLTPLSRWLAFGKLPENPIVTPSTSIQVIRPSANNKYLQTVTIEATTTPPTPGA